MLYDHVTKTDSYKIQHVYVEGPDRLYRSPRAAHVSTVCTSWPTLPQRQPTVDTTSLLVDLMSCAYLTAHFRGSSQLAAVSLVEVMSDVLSALTSKPCASWRLHMLQDPRLQGFHDMGRRYLPCLNASVKAYDSRVAFCVQAHSDAYATVSVSQKDS